MASVDNNLVMLNVRGMFGKQVVFKSRAGKAYVSAPPEIDENRVPTGNQLTARQRFRASTKYAKAANQDPETKKAYLAAAQPGQNAYNVALKDAYNSPEVRSVITQGYRGMPGDIIIIHAIDDFKVTTVQVGIYDPANKLIEEGSATANAEGLTWTYTATQSNLNTAGSTIVATAFDLPGNKGSLEMKLIV